MCLQTMFSTPWKCRHGYSLLKMTWPIWEFLGKFYSSSVSGDTCLHMFSNCSIKWELCQLGVILTVVLKAQISKLFGLGVSVDLLGMLQ